MLHPLVLAVVVVGRVEPEQVERPVGDRAAEEVAGERVVEPVGRLLRPLGVQLDPVGLDRHVAVHRVRQLAEGVARAAAGVEQPDDPVALAAVANRREQQRADVVDHARRGGVVAALQLASESHWLSSFRWSLGLDQAEQVVFEVFGDLGDLPAGLRALEPPAGVSSGPQRTVTMISLSAVGSLTGCLPGTAPAG